MAVLSAAAVMTAVTPSLLNGPATVLAASSGWVDENGTLRYYDSDGDYVTEEFLNYVKPLIQGDVPPIMVDGIPRHLYHNDKW